MVDSHQLEQWLAKLRLGTLGDEDLQSALARLNDQDGVAPGPQRLLYLQTQSTGVDSPVKGMSFVRDGQVLPGPDDPADWPYATVIEAMNDGWRVVKFPELSLLYQDPDSVAFGCEFILEK